MKTLILYDRNTGDVITTTAPVEHNNYATLVADVNETKQIARVEDGEVVYADPVEIIEKRKRLEALLNEVSNIRKDLLYYEMKKWWIMESKNWIYDYIHDLVEIKFITKDEAMYFTEGFHNKKRLSDAEYKSLILLIEITYKE